MGKLRKVLTGLGCAASVATGIAAGKVVGMKTYEYTGSTEMAGIAGGGTAAAVGISGIGTTLLISGAVKAAEDEKAWNAEMKQLEKKYREMDGDASFYEMKYDDLSKLYDELMQHNKELVEENQRLKEREAKRHERLRQTAQKNSEDGQDEPNCFDVFKEDKK